MSEDIFVRPSGTTDLKNIRYCAWAEPQPYQAVGNAVPYRKPLLRDISDGLSNTMLVGERTGRPDLYRKGQLIDSYPYLNPNEGMDHHQAAWGISTHFWWLVFWHEQPINASNAQGIYSFHSTGANVGFADGSVRFLSESMNQDTLNAMATRSEGDLASQE